MKKNNLWEKFCTKVPTVRKNGVNDIFAVLEIVDTNYDLAKVTKLLGSMIKARSYQPQFKGLWQISGSRTEYLGIKLILLEYLISRLGISIFYEKLEF